MASLLSFHPHQSLFLSNQTRIRTTRTRFSGASFLQSRSVSFTRLNSSHFQHHQLDEILSRADGLLYTLADAVASAQESKPKEDWFTGIANYMEIILKILKDGLSTLHVPYAYGFAIILLTVLVKAATFPLTKKQVESAIAMRTLQPQVKAIQQRYTGDQERIQLETARLYKLAGVNPLAGCLPTLLTIPVWIGLYRALSNVANEGLLSERFFWIPSLSGPTTIADRQSGSGISWLFPFIDGQPPLGWSDTFAYLVLPILLIISQYISTQVMQASQPQSNDQSQQSAQIITKFLPLLIGYFALSVPSGLSLYWLTNNILSTSQQIWLQKLGGAKNPVKDYLERVSKDENINKSSVIDIPKDPSFEDLNSDVALRGERFKQMKEKEQGIKVVRQESDERGKRFRQLKEEEARKKKQKEEEKLKETLIEQKSSETETNNENNNNTPLSLNGELSINNNNNSNKNVTELSDNLNGSSLKEDSTDQTNKLQDQEKQRDDA
ncbi:hypothetical protein LUZ60_013767 [Juncus effusus]|nr:hypothetical protein LUZ60_013767 [Juncus effusus]